MIRYLLAALALAFPHWAQSVAVENKALRIGVQQADGSVRLVDKASGEAWSIPPPQLVLKDKAVVTARPSAPVTRRGDELTYRAGSGTTFRLRAAGGKPYMEYSVEPGPDVAEVLLLKDALALGPGERNYFAVPHRLGVLFPVAGDAPFSRRMKAYETSRGYSMSMFGAVKNGSALLITWQDPYTDILVDYAVEPARRLSMGLALRASARSVRLQPLGHGGYVEIAKAYRGVARELGYLVTLAEKMKSRPQVEQFFGAACADLAEHYKNDLGIDRAMLVLNGWINGGYDNRHPDVLPAAPEIGGDEGLKAASRRVKALGWLFGLHDNYQDMYREAASWNEDYIMKNRDRSLHAGGVWAGGPCWLICARKSVELARRPQNIPRVKELFSPTLYFSDTIFAAPPYECFDPKHPLSLTDDIRYKQELCDYMRNEFGLFGSEEGREWGVPHSDYFEGLMSHRTRFQRPNDNDIVIPLFELVYGDAIPLYTHQSDRPRPDKPEFILNHIAYAEMPVYYFGTHQYWKDPAQEFRPASGSESRMVFAKGGRFGAIDQFIKNTYEVLSPLHRITALMPMTDHRFLTPDRQVEGTRFGSDVEITVNYGAADFRTAKAVLPQYGFSVESPGLVAHYARSYDGKAYAEPTLVVVRSLDGKPLVNSGHVRFYRAFGDRNIPWRGNTIEVDAERVLRN